MRKWRAIILIVSLVLAIFLGILPWLCGRIVQHEIIKWVGTFKTPNYEYSLVSYQRGYRQSEAIVELRIRNQRILQSLYGSRRSEPVKFLIDYKIYHGPIIFPGFGRSLKSVYFGLAWGDAKIFIPHDSPVLKNFSTNNIGQGWFNVKFSGVIHLMLESKGFSFQDNASKFSVMLKQAINKASYYPQQHKLNKRFHYKQLAIRYQDKVYALYDVRVLSSLALGRYNLQVGHYKMSVPLFSINKNNKAWVLMKDLVLTLGRSIEGRVVDTHVNAALQQLTIAHNNYGPITLNLLTNNLSGRELAAMNSLMTEYYAKPQTEANKQYYYQRMKGLLPNLVSRGFQLHINPLQITLPSGNLSMTAIMTFPDLHHKPIVDLDRLYRKADISVNIVIPKLFMKKLLTHYFYLRQKQQQQDGNVQLAAQQADNLINAWEMLQLIVLKDGSYDMTTSYKGGVIYINGRPLTLEAIMQQQRIIKEYENDRSGRHP